MAEDDDDGDDDDDDDKNQLRGRGRPPGSTERERRRDCSEEHRPSWDLSENIWNEDEDGDGEYDDVEDDDTATPNIILKVFQICLHVENNKQTTMQRTNKDAIKVYFEYQQFFKDRHQHLTNIDITSLKITIAETLWVLWFHFESTPIKTIFWINTKIWNK